MRAAHKIDVQTPPAWAERFWAKVDKSGECWLWTAATIHSGYGRFQLWGKARGAHRVAWLLEHGEFPPDELFVCHRCDNPACVRPSHLFLGTPADNLRDMSEKGRSRRGLPNRGTRGTKNRHARLTPHAVRQIRRLRAEGMLHREIAEHFGVAVNTVTTILTGKSWTHV